MTLYAEVILPLPLVTTFTYQVPDELATVLKQGHRVLVPFGKKKFYTAIVVSLSPIKPTGYDVKPIIMALDDEPILKYPQLKLWDWVSEYYLCSTGDVMKAALPAALKVESETFLEINPDFDGTSAELPNEKESIVMQVLANSGKRLTVAEIERATGFKNVSALASGMLEKGELIVSEKLVERYVARKVTYVKINAERNDSQRLHEMFDMVSRARKQEQALLTLLEMTGFMQKNKETPTEVTLQGLLERSKLSRPVISEMAKKGLVEIYRKEINRFAMTGKPTGELPDLSQHQKEALDSLHSSWKKHEITLLHGVTSSGKTEIYIHLIDFILKQGRQVLYMVPEIALTTQLTARLQKVFGEKVVIYHSKFSDNERVDIYRKLLSTRESLIVVGPRSAVFLPFSNLGLVIIDEEHESSYKQQDPAPRYNGRDTAIMLARMHGAKTLLGSATPAIDTFFKAQSGKYGLVTLSERFGGVKLPEIDIVDTTQARRSSLMKGALALDTIASIKQSVDNGNQAIIFLNRRGYAPVAQCNQCAWIPKCEHCDVSLTYHKRIDKLVCHYCGSMYPLPTICPACKEPSIEVHGYGTERMEDEIAPALGNVKTLRMDLDTTRNKDGYQQIISDFSQGKAQVLVGTQMVTKGLDFDKVSTVAIINADAMINQPDFRASERAFNMISQVAGRAGRRNSQGNVILQTRQPGHPIIPLIVNHDYSGFYKTELDERRRFNYPPFTRLIYIYLKHRDPRALDELASAYGHRLRELFGNRVFGPEEPAVGRVQTLYIRKIMLKIEVNASMKKVKDILRATFEEMHRSGMGAVKSAVIYYDVDPV